MKKPLLFIVAGLISVSGFSQAEYCGKVVGGYVPDWISNPPINYDQLTHAYFAFIGSDNSGNLCTYENSSGSTVVKGKFEDRPEIMATWNDFLAKTTAAKCKKIISIGGYGCDNFMNAMVSGGNTSKFVTNIMNFVDTYKLDGVDLDWEDLADATQGNNYKTLLTALSTALKDKKKLLFATVVIGYRVPNFPQSDIASKVDYVQLMAYDQTATWDSSPFGNHSTVADVNTGISKWSQVAGNKIVVGVPFYGYQQKNSGGNKTADWTWNAFYTKYQQDVDNFPVPGTSETIGLNGTATIKDKTAIGYGKGGVMVWEMTQDLAYTHAKSLHLAMITKMKELCPNGHGNTTGINEVSSSVSNLHYNALLNQLEFAVTTTGKATITLSNMLGQNVFSKTIESSSAGIYNVSLSGVDLSNGIYVANVMIGNDSASAKIYVQ